MFENHYVVDLNLLSVVVVVIGDLHENNLYDFAEEFLELNLIVDNIHVQVFGLKAEKIYNIYD